MLDGEPATSLLQNTVFVDFRERQQYFTKLFQLILTLHQIPPDHPGIVELGSDSP